MKSYQAYIIDLDGTMYRGTERIEGAKEFVDHLKKNGKPFLYLTNNSSKRPEQIAEKLNNLGVHADSEQVFTSSMATASYISEQKKCADVFVIGEEGLRDAIRQEGHRLVEEKADYVVIGIDREINYEKYVKACLNVRNGAELLSTNGDIAIPTERGMLPGNGAMTSVITVSTGVEPTFIGKPEAIIMNQALNQLGFPKEEALLVGDNYNTDILAGIHAGIDTLMLETGVSTFEEIKGMDKQPTYKSKNLIDWLKA
ncbi:TIGR01457 family HAD-type hydrolase [Halobacillus yeomjeoni]|uniref:TIGR01457 family HAD-type hydrolase n=1 Tax=Halobacillus yeomjeoni TaxID=311194 RepID=A0A931HWF6_9BACI|nr:TIGR01457 family HAD-type hydrolase [Halobacillus yeomjeoni]MBH0231037.1 TIGR01457 family HAD-type hydrolase [Halobacillus yeomjeoni]MCA0984519.1 TIGR01457 family HAD-type hydrolase [Halobacillus yeomjeoni]